MGQTRKVLQFSTVSHFADAIQSHLETACLSNLEIRHLQYKFDIYSLSGHTADVYM